MSRPQRAFWSDCLANAFRDFIRRNRVVGIEKRNLAPGRSATPRGQSNGLVMHVVIVRGRQNIIAFAQRQSVVEKSETGRGVLGQRDVLRVAADVAGDDPANLQRNIFVARFKDRAITAINGFASIFSLYCSIACRTGLG